jgi:ariadne-1
MERTISELTYGNNSNYFDDNCYIVDNDDNDENTELPKLDLIKMNSISEITDEDIDIQRDKIIQKGMDYTCLTRDQAILVLIHFRWDWNNLENNWYNNVDSYLEEVGIIQTKESLATTKKFANTKECLVCYTPCSPYIALTCNHNFCEDCWFEYLKTRLDSVYIILFTTCPQKGCNIRVYESNLRIHYKADPKTDNLMHLAVKKNFFENNTEIKNCPKCQANVRCDLKTNVEIDCSCGHSFCFKCLGVSHKPCTCEMISKWDIHGNESKDAEWIVQSTKQCPNCKKYIQKNQGCNHMTCRREAGGCTYEFCWLCLGNWRTHSTCNQFAEKVIGSLKDIKLEKNSAKHKKEYERFMHYNERFVNLSDAYDKIDGLKISARECKKVLNTVKNIPEMELTFLEDGIQALYKATRMLKNSYIFAYYLSKRALFEHTQSLLERQVDDLHEYFAAGNLKNLIEIESFELFNLQFKDLKNNIMNLSQASLKFVDNLISECELNIDDWINHDQLRQSSLTKFLDVGDYKHKKL